LAFMSGETLLWTSPMVKNFGISIRENNSFAH